ncbi:peptidoglycan-binding protein [Caulobacter sp. S45]|uniref:peptidoglycan-binding domain-containing protein n=1 Tax=Caulobacter sp. S45 TaxID=1641861 RepID=UPI0015764DD5|nr:peptidoglycan-binding domain-containing protein [Caulobacter sp. S45]
MKPLLIALARAAVVLGVSASPAFAPMAVAQGGCVGKVLLPPSESERSERVLTSPGHVERLHLPPQVERFGRQVMVRPARQERVRLAAVYRVERSAYSAPGPMRWVREPDSYADVAEHVLVAPGHYVWEQRYGPLVSGAPQPGQTMVTPTGLVMCKVWCPARYETVMHRVRTARGRVYGVRTSIQHVVAHRVLMRPAMMSVRRIPAEYHWISTERMVAPGRWMERRTAPEYAWRTTREVHDGGATYAPVVCGGPLSRPAMARMQASLAAQGYDAGPQDGIGRAQTYEALRRFQVDHRLAAGQVTVESARALGVVQ